MTDKSLSNGMAHIITLCYWQKLTQTLTMPSLFMYNHSNSKRDVDPFPSHSKSPSSTQIEVLRHSSRPISALVYFHKMLLF